MVEVFHAARDSGRDLLLSAVNWGEVHYLTLRKAGCERAEQEAGFSGAQNFPPVGLYDGVIAPKWRRPAWDMTRKFRPDLTCSSPKAASAITIIPCYATLKCRCVAKKQSYFSVL
jgi:hypothetical protein